MPNTWTKLPKRCHGFAYVNVKLRFQGVCVVDCWLQMAGLFHWLQHSSIYADLRKESLRYDHGFAQTDSSIKLSTGTSEGAAEVLKDGSGGCHKGSIVRTEQFSDEHLSHFRLCTKIGKVKQISQRCDNAVILQTVAEMQVWALSSAVRKITKRVGAWTYPCLTPRLIEKWHLEPSSWTIACMSSWSFRIMLIRKKPKRLRIANNTELLTRLKALIRSMNATYRGCCCSMHFSWSCLNANTTSMVERDERKPHWLSGRTFSLMTCRLGRSTRAKTFPAALSSEISR